MKKVWGKDLYIISAGPELTKLGRSQNPQKRLQEISRGLPFVQCRLWAIFPDVGALESALHKELSLGNARCGEWYQVPAVDVARTVVSRLGALTEADGDP